MKNCIIALGAIVALAGSAQAADLAVFTFEASIPTTGGPHSAEGGVFQPISQATGVHADALTIFSNPVGNGSGESFSSDRWATGDYYQIKTSTAGYNNIAISFDQTRSSTGPSTFDLLWSSDGVNFASLIDNYSVIQNSAAPAGAGAWSSGGARNPAYLIAAALPAGASDLGMIWFRIQSDFPTGATGGTNRIDNVVVTGDLIPTPGAVALMGFAGLAAARRRRA